MLGIVYATLVENGRTGGNGRGQATPQENLAKAIQHLEQALERPSGESDPNVRATLRAPVSAPPSRYDKAIPLLVDLVNQEPGWSDGPSLLAQAYANAGRNAEAIAWLVDAAQDDPRSAADARRVSTSAKRRWSEAAGHLRAGDQGVAAQRQSSRRSSVSADERAAGATSLARGA